MNLKYKEMNLHMKRNYILSNSKFGADRDTKLACTNKYTK